MRRPDRPSCVRTPCARTIHGGRALHLLGRRDGDDAKPRQIRVTPGQPWSSRKLPLSWKILEAAPGFEPGYGALQAEKRRSLGFAEVQKAQVRIHICPRPFSPILGVPRYNDGIK